MAYKKGESGNPGGRIKGKDKQIRELLLPHVQEAVNALLKGLKDERQYILAAEKILDRVYGKATQQVEAKGDIHVKVSFEGS